MPPEVAAGTPSAVSDSEVLIMAGLLAAGAETEEDRIRATGLARSTYQEGKRRIYARGWLEDRYVPAPRLLRVPSVSFLLLRPFAEKVAESAGRLRENAEAVLVWQAEETLFAVLFHRSSASGQKFARLVGDGSLGGDAYLLSVDPGRPTVPVYFDFEALFAEWTGRRTVRRYPRPLLLPPPRASASGGPAVALPSALGPLVRRPFLSGDESRAPHLLGPAGIPRSQRRLLEGGQVEWRVLPRLENLPPCRDRRFSHVVLARGVLRPGARLLELYRGLVADGISPPFLLASDGEHVLAGLAKISPMESAPAGDEEAAARGLREALSAQLEGIDLARLPLAGLKTLVAHRYDRLVPP